MAGIMMPYMSSIGQMGYVAPNTIPSLSLWYNGSSSSTLVNGVSTLNFQGAVSNGSLITKWVDLQNVAGPSNVNGGNNSFDPVYTTSIQNGLGAVLYNSANSQNLDINPISFAANKAGMTIYVVARPTSFPATQFPLVVTDQGMGIFWNGTNWTCGVTTSYYGTTSVTNNTSKFHMYGVVFGGSSAVNFRYDKMATTLSYTGSAPANTGSQSYMYFGGDNRSGGQGGSLSNTYMSGYIGEVLIWQRALSNAEISSVELYINQKWGLGL